MKIYIFIFVFAVSSFAELLSQRQADNWVWGLCSPDNGCPEPYGSGVLKFNNTGLESIESANFQYRINKGSASISDSLGNLLLVFNGKYLFDSTGAIIDSFYIGDFSEMPVGFKNSLFLSVPDKPDNYCLFNSYWNPLFDNSFFLGFDSSFYYSEFKTTDSEIETIIRKQLIELDSSAAGTIAACRHANGRDWWIMKSSVYQDKFYQALLDPTGFEFNAIYSPVPHVHQPGAGWNLFSSNGDKFVNVIIGSVRKAFIYDFDRCTGELSNPIEHDLSSYLNEDAVNACCLSPDGTKLYFRRSNLNAFLTIELCQYDFETSIFSVIAEGQGAPCLTPNNLWVVSPTTDFTSNPYEPKLSVLYQPNNPTLNCGFTPQVYDLINYGFIEVSPNYANFRLGALTGSICDSLSSGIQSISNNSNIRFKIFPNPFESSLTIEQDIPSQCEVIISDMLGRINWKGQINNQKTVLSNEINGLCQGIYWIEIQDLKTGNRSGKKFIKH
jgi:hypothetical protein